MTGAIASLLPIKRMIRRISHLGREEDDIKTVATGPHLTWAIRPSVRWYAKPLIVSTSKQIHVIR